MDNSRFVKHGLTSIISIYVTDLHLWSGVVKNVTASFLETETAIESWTATLQYQQAELHYKMPGH